MADETTYESEMNQPSHRPGMESVVNRGEPVTRRGMVTHKAAVSPTTHDPLDDRDADGNRTSSTRPTATPGKVDPFSIRGDGPPKATSSAPAANAPGTDPQTNQGISGIGGRTRESEVMDATDKAVTG